MTSNRPPAIIVNDSTLQDVRAPLSRRNQIDIAMELEQAGVDEIELRLSPSGHDAIEDVALVGAALVRSQPIMSGPATRGTVNAAIRAGLDAVYLSVSLSASRAGLLAGVNRAVGYAAERGLAVAVSGEDASRADLDLICDVVAAAEVSGARRFRYTDTTGVLHPIRTHRLFRQLCAETDLELEFRGHDHFGLATANTMAAIQGGATHVSVIVAGTDGEARPAQLADVTEAIRLSAVHHTHVDMARLPALAALVAARTGRPIGFYPPVLTPRMPWLVVPEALGPQSAPRAWGQAGVAGDVGDSDHAPR